jgi:hypothetical protein
MNNAVATIDQLARRSEHRVDVCTDPYHAHPCPIHDMFGCEFRGHWVAVTISGAEYSVRIDRNPLTDRHGMTECEASTYIERMTK